jgi:4-hydroxy-tetrahydrodipicolinate synthase
VAHVAPQGDGPVDGGGLVGGEVEIVGDAAAYRRYRRPMSAVDPLFTGVGVALVTLFDGDGELDAEATARHAAHLVDRGVRGVLVAGSTGEAAALEPDERTRLVVAVREAVGARVPVIAGTGAPSARQAVELSRRAAADGADGLLALSPPATDDPRPYYEAVSGSVATPVLAYHFPAHSAPGIPVDLLCELPVVGIKDSTGDPARLAVEIDEKGRGVYTGSAALALQAAAMGATGAILALANVDPDGCARAWDGDGACQRDLVNGHRVGALSGVAGIKRVLHGLYGTSVTTRLP